ncbi:MAG: deoxyribonuclease [bacterium]|nr:deoxyribonuclease [bacterium]
MSINQTNLLSALNDAGCKSLDWWFMYKVPKNTTIKNNQSKDQDNTGSGYLYYDCEKKKAGLSPNLLGESKGALYDTLQQLFGPGGNSDNGWILYNDEIPETKKNNESKGHTKGVLAFNKVNNSAFWLLHSTPRFPLPGNSIFPVDEKEYGQTFLCITLKDYDTAEQLAGVMRAQQEPQVYGNFIPKSVPGESNLAGLAAGQDAPKPAEPADLTFYSKAGNEFRCFAKNRHWGEDFWIDLVGPALQVDLDVETWRRLALPSTEDSNNIDDVKDVLYIDLEPLGVEYQWHYTKDHSKWAVSDKPSTETQKGDWVCVADINRQVSQEKRGGGAICFKDKTLRDILKSIYKSDNKN